LRTAIADALPDDFVRGNPLYLLLDDIAGASLVAPWSLTRWTPEQVMMSAKEAAKRRPSMEGVCIGFNPGSPALSGTLLCQAPGRSSRSTLSMIPWPGTRFSTNAGLRCGGHGGSMSVSKRRLLSMPIFRTAA
jgi:hypothetical protein